MDSKTKQTLTFIGVGVIAFVGVRYFLGKRDGKTVQESILHANPFSKPSEPKSSACGCGA